MNKYLHSDSSLDSNVKCQSLFLSNNLQVIDNGNCCKFNKQNVRYKVIA